MDRDFQRRRREFQEDLGVRKNEELQTVIERANRVITVCGQLEPPLNSWNSATRRCPSQPVGAGVKTFETRTLRRHLALNFR